MTIEQRLDQLEKRNKRLMATLTLTVVAMCAVVTVGAPTVRDISNSENGRYAFHMDSVRSSLVYWWDLCQA